MQPKQRRRPGAEQGEAALVALQQRLAGCSELGALLSELAGGLAPLLPVRDRVSIVFLEPDGEWMRIYRLLPEVDAGKSERPRVRVDGTPVGQVVREGVGRVVADVRRDPNITFGHASHERIRSTISTPIRVAGRVVGAINAGSRTVGACDHAMLRSLEELVAVVGPTIYAAEALLAESARAPEPAAEPAGLVGNSPAFRALITAAQRAARSDADVLITGETGVGKTALARAIHRWSDRRQGPFVTVHIADLAPTVVESELFGHQRGAFTGAVVDRAGRFERAHGGTLFLDELGETEPAIQAKLLRVIQDRCFERVGGSRTIRADVRVIAATSRDLRQDMASGRFRDDLFYRLNVVPLHVPPLRDRRDDVAALVESILGAIAAGSGRRRSLSASAWQRLASYSWPGNIRELEMVLRRAAILEDGDELLLEGFPDAADAGAAASLPRQWPTLDEHQRRYIQDVLERCGGVIEGAQGAAQLLGLRPSTLRSRMQRLGVSASAARNGGK